MDHDVFLKLKDIGNEVVRGKISLFLGAGCSIDSGLPNWDTLKVMLLKRFPSCDQTLTSFFDLCQDIIDTPPYNRHEIEEFLFEMFSGFRVTYPFKELVKYDWATIFTTNYDSIIETAYTDPQRLRPCRAILADNPSISISDRSKTQLFKIMGDLTKKSPEEGKMVLTLRDYTETYVRRSNYFKILGDILKSGRIVFIGYSFRDYIARSIIEEIIKVNGIDQLQWSYALYNEPIPNDAKAQFFFNSHKIIPIYCEFKEFFEFIRDNCDSKLILPSINFPHISARLRIFSKLIEFTEEEVRSFSTAFYFLTEEKLIQPAGDKDAFFRNSSYNPAEYKENWDFIRDIYYDETYFSGQRLCLKQRIEEELKGEDPEQNIILSLLGMPGSGKSFLGRRIAFDFYSSGKAPVLIISGDKPNIDFKIITTFIEDINNQLDDLWKGGEKLKRVKPIIIFDDAAKYYKDISRLNQFLKSRGRLALIIAIERINEWNSIAAVNLFKIRDFDTYIINEKLTNNEEGRLIDHLYNIGYLPVKDIFWKELVKQVYEDSFFACIYSFIHPSKLPLNEIIKNQYLSMSEMARRVYSYICCFSQFNLQINIELLVRTIKYSYDQFVSEILQKECLKIIYEEIDDDNNLLYRAHHKIIAKKTIEFYYPDSEQQLSLISELLSNVLYGNLKELQLCEQLIIDYLTSDTDGLKFTIDQKRRIFHLACQRFPTRSLYHHWGLLETEEKQFAEATVLLNKALKFEEHIDSFPTESINNIVTSLGKLYSRQGFDCYKKGEEQKANEFFQEAERMFDSAKHVDFPNVHAYHSHAFMWYVKGNESGNEGKRIDAYANALAILSLAKDNLNEEDQQIIFELEADIWTNIGDETRIQKYIEILRDTFKSPNGYLIGAAHQMNKYRKAKDSSNPESIEFLKLAFRKVEKGLIYFPSVETLLLERAKVYSEFPDRDNAIYFQYLNEWYSISTNRSANLMYELGRISFLLGYFDLSKKVFSELESTVGLGHSRRGKLSFPITEGNIPVLYYGEIARIINRNEGLIKCSTIRGLKYFLHFKPVTLRYTPRDGDYVAFNIAFSFRGPNAINVKKA